MARPGVLSPLRGYGWEGAYVRGFASLTYGYMRTPLRGYPWGTGGFRGLTSLIPRLHADAP